MVTFIRDVIADMIKSGMTLEQVKRADPRRRSGRGSGQIRGPGLPTCLSR